MKSKNSISILLLQCVLIFSSFKLEANNSVVNKSKSEVHVCENCSPEPSLNLPEMNLRTKDCDPAVGSETLVNESNRLNAYGGNYSIKHVTKNNFEAEVNLRFTVNFLNSRQSARDTQSFKERAQYCLDRFEPYLKGPNGESLKIKITDNPKIKPSVVNLNPNVIRSRDNDYSSNINCVTLLHEVLHVMGLVDEYQEQSLGYYYNPQTGQEHLVEDKSKNPLALSLYDCRAIGPEESIMSDHDLALALVFPVIRSEFKKCVCENKETLCDYAPDPNLCGPGYKTITETFNLTPEVAKRIEIYSSKIPADLIQPIKNTNPEDQSIFLDGSYDIFIPEIPGFMQEYYIPVKSEELPPVKKSLLMAAHFRMLTKPLCLAENYKYLECARFAYESSGVEACMEKPKHCQSKNWLQ